MTPDPLHTIVDGSTTWTTVNVAEAMPGVLTPLTWTFWMPATERGSRRSYYEQGIFPRSMTALPERPGDRFQAVFYGRAAVNPDLARLLGDLTPGGDGADTEARLLGSARDLPDRSTNRRIPFFAIRFGYQVVTIRKRLRRTLEDTRRWWSTAAWRDDLSYDDAVALLLEARRRFEEIIVDHTTATCVGLLFTEGLSRLVPEGAPVEAALSGLGELEELSLLDDLVRCGRGQLDVEGLARAHGFHGPDEGQLQSPSWREDPGGLHVLVERYRTLPAERQPAAVLARQQDQRGAAVETLTRAVHPARRWLVRLVLRGAARTVPLREVGKTAFLMAIDVGRHAARVAGRRLVEQGRLANADDVFLLTVEELIELPRVELAPLLDERRQRQRHYETLELPTVWSGEPVPRHPTASPEPLRRGDEVKGDGVSAGLVEGPVLVAPDLATAFGAEPGQIVACHATDPGWATVFPILGGLIVEVGSHTSHAAIVARELGLPCIVGVEGATVRFRTGMRVRLDAGAGTVAVLDAP